MPKSRERLSWVIRRPFQAVARAIQLLIVQRTKYARSGGYDAEHYWRDRLARHGLSLRGPGREARSEAENVADYAAAAEAFRGFCREADLDLHGTAVLDIGCGSGFYAGLCRDQGVRAYVGVDITDALFADLARQFPAFRFLKADATADRLDGTFDVILMIDVVEHIVTEEKLNVAMENVQRCLARGGAFVLGMPSRRSGPGGSSTSTTGAKRRSRAACRGFWWRGRDRSGMDGSSCSDGRPPVRERRSYGPGHGLCPPRWGTCRTAEPEFHEPLTSMTSSQREL